MKTETNFSLVERAQGHGPAIDQDELLDLLAELDAWREAVSEYHVGSPEECAVLVAELEAWRDAVADYNADSPEECAVLVAKLEANQKNPDQADYDDLKEFFDDCVSALEDESGRWPYAGAYDLNLRRVICDAIRNGAE